MTTFTKEEWLDRAALHYINRARVSKHDAEDFAEALYEEFSSEHSPEDAVDEDLTYWGQ